MSYRDALEEAGATILEFESFGSYQGDWLALVEYKGQIGFVGGYFGSCSGCDAFEAEFNYSPECDEHYTVEPSCSTCRTAREQYDEALREFGRGYLEDAEGNPVLESYDYQLKKASKNLEWDSDARSMVSWLKGVKERHLEKI